MTTNLRARSLSGLTIMALLFCTQAIAQLTNIPLSRQVAAEYESQLLRQGKAYHSSVKPYRYEQISQERQILLNKQSEWHYRKLFKEHLIIVKEPDLQLTADPLLHFEFGKDLADNTPSRISYNSRGAVVEGEIAGKVGFYTSFLESQAFMPDYLSAYANTWDVVPGLGRVKPFKTGGFDYAVATGYVSFNIQKNVNVQFGHDKRFVGDGYRSMLLSDNAFNYPFVQISSELFKDKLRLTNIYASLQSLNRLPYRSTPEALFERKAATFHILSYLPTEKLEISLFEGTMWQRMDSVRQSIAFNPVFINPAPGLGAGINGMNGVNNVVLGITGRYSMLKKVSVYAQIALDDPSSGKTGFQVGVRTFDLGIDGLDLQVEFNQATNFLFAHQDSLQNYGHYNQPLAHPLGAGFTEVVGIVDYSYRSFFGKAQINFATFPNDDGQYNLGTNIFRSDANQTTGAVNSGVVNLLNISFTAGYVFNAASNAQIFGGFARREALRSGGTVGSENMNYLFIGLATRLWNTYNDI